MNDSRKDSKHRRKQRQKQSVWSVLAGLPHPWGSAAASQYSDLSKWQDAQPPVDWSSIPAQCEPCAMLSNPSNRGKKHGKTVMEQIGMLEFEAPVDLQPTLSNHTQRGMHKRWQVESFLLVLRRLIAADPLRPWNIVDFGCGTGSLLLPLACLFPTCTFTGVDMKPAALAILRQRAAASALTNVHTFLGMIEQYEQPLDIALALHACGNATDVAILRAQQHRAAYIVSPCCVGKLKFSLAGGTSFGPTAAGWRWMPRLRGSEQQVQLAGQWLRAAACGQELPPLDMNAARVPDAAGAEPRGGPSSLGAEGGSNPAPPALEAGVPGGTQAAEAPGSEEEEREGQGRLEPPGPAAEAPSQKPNLELRHPRSQALLQLLPDPHQNFKMLAQVADTNLSLEERRVAMGRPQPHALVLATVWSKLEREGEEGHAAQDEDTAGSADDLDSQQQQQQQQQEPVTAKELIGTSSPQKGCTASPAAAPVPGRGHLGSAGDLFETESSRNAAQCALAKLHIEIDRNEQAREEGYAVGILRMLNAQSMAKGDLLVGLPAEAEVWSCLLPLLRKPESLSCSE